jgi:TetR/AcrR family transcriptional regulator, regulator of biofilm formation and stress response
MISEVEATTAEAILDATLSIVGERGLEAVTHRAVAEQAGVSLGAISHYHQSREDLLREALRHAAATAVARLERLALDLQTRIFDTGEWVEAMAGAVADDLRRNRVGQLAQFELLLAAARYPEFRERSRAWRRAHLRVAEVGLRAAGSRSPEVHATLLVAAMTGLMIKQLAFPERSFGRAHLTGLLQELVNALVSSEGEKRE